MPKKKLDLKIYGENGITILWFSSLLYQSGRGRKGQRGAVKNFLRHTVKDLDGKSLLKGKLDHNRIDEIILFYNFGKGGREDWGSFGEPDAILITKNYTIYFEFETAAFDNIEKRFKYPWKQLVRFYQFGLSQPDRSTKELIYPAEKKLRYRIPTKNEHLFGLLHQMKGPNWDKPFYVVCVSDDENPPPIYKAKANAFVDSLSGQNPQGKFGWMGYPDMKAWLESKPVGKNWPKIAEMMHEGALRWSTLRKFL